uniref:DDE Tnp4 domain-containing protein n=1 Tax=Mycena chlorophos TaxID=658473 RepID=A0ABQ0KX03_MYCCL|nr:predicted protein [Mycena chlorophos]
MPLTRHEKIFRYLLTRQLASAYNALPLGLLVAAAPPDDALLLSNNLPLLHYARPEIAGTRISLAWLKKLKPSACLYHFRFYAEEIQRLVEALDIPQPFKTQNRCVFSDIEALCLLLARFRTAGDQFQLSTQFGRSQAAISQVVNELCEYLDTRWEHLLDFDTTVVLSPERLQDYAAAIFNAGAPIPTVWGFLDCTIRPICRPYRLQRIAYNGYKKVHALKYQAVKLPNGLIGHLYGPMEGRRNDNALLASSRLLERCQEHATRPNTTANTPAAAHYFQLFGDPAYGLSPLLISPYAGVERTGEETEWNEAMAAMRIEVEHGFGGVTAKWPFLNSWWTHRIFSSPIGHHYRIGVLLTNALNCLRPNQTSQFFKCSPPELEEYFHDE